GRLCFPARPEGKRMWRSTGFARAIVAACLIGLLALVLVPSAMLLPHLEYWTADWRTAFLSDQAKGPHDRIAVVLIDDATLEAYPYLSPTNRELIKEIVQGLYAADAAVIGLDFFFIRPTEPQKDDALVGALRERPELPVIVGFADERIALNARQ